MSVTPVLLRAIGCAACCALLAGVLAAQEGETIVEVEIRGRAKMAVDRILDNLKTRQGQPFSREVLSEDIKTLYENEDFRILAVRTEIVPVAGGVKVILHVRQDDRITSVRFSGVVREDEEELRTLLGLRQGAVISPYTLASYAEMIRNHYRNKGYYCAEVNIWREPAPAAEGKDDGAGAVFEVFEGRKVTVDDIEFIGCNLLDPGDLKSVMELDTPTLWIFTTKLKADELQKDVGRLNEFARSQGFLDAKISLEDVRLDEEFNDADIVFRVQEGPRYKIGAVSVRFGAPAEPAESIEFSEQEIFELIEVKIGDDYRQARIDRDVRRIVEFYGNRGYIRAEVNSPAHVYHEAEPVVDLIFWVDEDRKKYVRDVVIEGNTLTREKVIRREITLYPGDVFKRDELIWSKNQLSSLQYFTDERGQPRVLAEPRETEDPNYEDLYVEVEEGSTGNFFFTVGASTDGGLFGGVRIAKRNFDITDTPSSPWAGPVEFFTHDAFHGAGQMLQLSAMPGQVYSTYDIFFSEPYFFDTQPNPISLAVNLYHRATDYDEYDVTRTGFLAPRFGKRLSRLWNISVGFRKELIKVRDVTEDAPLEAKELEGNTGKHAIESAINFRKVDNPYDPKQGLTAGLSWEYMGGVLGNDLDMNKIYVDGTYHLPAYETPAGKTHVLIFRTNVGWAGEHSGMDDVPIFESFFAGGSTGQFPIRGFEWRGVGPRDPNGEPLGGEFAYSMSAEYMIPLYSLYDPYYDVETPIFRGVVFLDAGGVAPDLQDTEELRKLRSSYGAGLRITLPVLGGLPIALDYGIPLKRYTNDERRSFSFNIQHWF